MTALLPGLKYVFKNPRLLEEALTHPSTSNNASSGFERLEFLGDRVLGLVIAEWLLDLYPDETEGTLAKRFAQFTRKEALVEVAKALKLEDAVHMRLEDSAVHEKRQNTIISDACEALIAALYLDGGLTAATTFIHEWWAPYVTTNRSIYTDPKSALQEWVQAEGKSHPTYHIISTTGPAHAPIFVIEAHVEGLDPVQAEGSSKINAQRAAAKLILDTIHAQTSKVPS